MDWQPSERDSAPGRGAAGPEMRPTTEDATMDDKTAAIFDLLPPIFRDAVDPDPDRKFWLCHPRIVGDHVYATDARICVRAPATSEHDAAMPALPEGKKFVKPESLLAVFGDDSAWHAEPTSLPPLDGFERCAACAGTGRLLERKCGGCDDGWDDEPRGCNGRGIIPAGECDHCHGTTLKDPLARHVTLRDDVWLSLLYASVLVRHGATVYLPVEANTPERTTPVRFTVAGAEGRLMPMMSEAMRRPVKAKKVRA